jgi:DNA polymerase
LIKFWKLVDLPAANIFLSAILLNAGHPIIVFPYRRKHIFLPWLIKQIELINPTILILLGATALKYMAGPEHRITRERGSWLTLQNRLAMPVYHPAALLRDPSLKRDTWEDFKKIVFKYRELVNPKHYSAHV